MNPEALAQKPKGADGAFVVHLKQSQTNLTVQPGQTVLQVLLDHGVDIPFACQDGVCGTCLTPVLAGQPEHWDAFLTPDEQATNRQMTPCCSGSLSACLILDV
jgi:ferredoxin